MARCPESEFDPQLLDLHLGRLSASERAEVEARLARDPQLAAEDQALRALFAALDSARQPEPELPRGLRERIGARVAALGPPPRVVRARRSPAAELAEAEGARVVRLHSFREVAAVAAVIVLAIGLGVPGLLHMRQRAQRIACSANLASIGRGMQAYALANLGSLPFVGWGADHSWRPTDEPGVVVLPNRRHMYPLLRTRLVPARVFICPSGSDVPMPEDQVPTHEDFLEARNVSYAYQNMAGARPRLRDNPDLPVLADDNPFFDRGWPLFAVARSLGLADPARTNSRAHGGSGQNILTIRGTVKWTTTPNCGPHGDNIWTLNGVEEYTGREGPLTTTDAHLLK